MNEPDPGRIAAAREAQFLALLRAEARSPDDRPGLFDEESLATDGMALRPRARAFSRAWLTGRSGWGLPNAIWRAAWRVWRFARALSGDDAYDRYLGHMARAHPGQTPMTRAEHYRFMQDEKWDRPSRCC
jgi:uncharacterized short protein YbdD (DUF466 family)